MTIDMHHVLDYVAYWVLFWSMVNIVLPPREVFADDQGRIPRWYNTLLKLVAYYGSLNLRQVSVKLYSAVNQAPPTQLQDVLNVAAKDVAKAADAVETAKAVAPPPDK